MREGRSPVQVALDTNSLYITRAGTSRYVSSLVRGLRALALPDLQVSELAWAVDNFSYRQPWRAAKTLYRELLWSRLTAPRRLIGLRADILHRCTPALPIVLPRGVREVVTLYDLGVLRHPERYRPWHRQAQLRRLGLLRRADRIICISRFTADEAITLLGLPAAQMEVIYLGSDMAAAGVTRPCAPDLPVDYFLFVGSLEPGKNLELLRGVYALADARGIDLPALAIVGVRWPGVRREGPADRRWVWLGYQPDDVLAQLYRRAQALVFPSVYEGFGLPVLEAMTMGCPVVCSRVASLPEVGGEAVWYADLTPEAYLQALRVLASDARARLHLSEAGISEARRFSWELCARQTAEVYRALLHG